MNCLYQIIQVTNACPSMWISQACRLWELNLYKIYLANKYEFKVVCARVELSINILTKLNILRRKTEPQNIPFFILDPLRTYTHEANLSSKK